MAMQTNGRKEERDKTCGKGMIKSPQIAGYPLPPRISRMRRHEILLQEVTSTLTTPIFQLLYFMYYGKGRDHTAVLAYCIGHIARHRQKAMQNGDLQVLWRRSSGSVRSTRPTTSRGRWRIAWS